MSVRLILLGAPGSGKGTQAELLTVRYKIPQISTGDMLRAAMRSGSGAGKELEKIMQQGLLVSDSLILKLVKERLAGEDCRSGYLLDGFPRTLSQAEGIRCEGVGLDFVFVLQVDDAVIIRRLGGRRVHPASGRVYHLDFRPPRRPGLDDVSAEPLVQRDDDQEQTVRKRLQVYQKQTLPLLDYYRDWAQSGRKDMPRLYQIDGTLPAEEIHRNITSYIEKKE